MLQKYSTPFASAPVARNPHVSVTKHMCGEDKPPSHPSNGNASITAALNKTDMMLAADYFVNADPYIACLDDALTRRSGHVFFWIQQSHETNCSMPATVIHLEIGNRSRFFSPSGQCDDRGLRAAELQLSLTQSWSNPATAQSQKPAAGK